MRATQEMETEILLSGQHGNLCKIPLTKCPTLKTDDLLRPGEDTCVYERVLSTIQLGNRLKDPPSLLALHRFKIWWMRPIFTCPIPPETVLLLDRVVVVEDSVGTTKYRLVLPVVLPQDNGMSFASASIRGISRDTGEQLILCGNHMEAGLYVGIGEDPYDLVKEGVQLASKLWQGTIKQRDTRINHDSNNNIAINKLGWCTWNAFYTDINGEIVVQAVRSLLQDHDIPIRWMILDDGWQHITSSDDEGSGDPSPKLDGFQWSKRLLSYREDPAKFQALSLKDSIQQLRDSGMEAVWVWHTLAGYWLGISSSFLNTAKLQYAHFPPGILDNDSSACREPSIDQGIGITADPEDFFRQYHSDYLSSICKVDGIKVDAQGVVGILKPHKASENLASDYDTKTFIAPVIALHDALADSVFENFVKQQSNDDLLLNEEQNKPSPSIIHCMAHAPEIFYRLPSLYQGKGLSPLFRVADDFYPDNPHSHGPQIVACAYNSLLFQHVATPDWDMFATSTEIDPAILQCHAVARCISGGPIYFSSSPEELPKDSGVGQRPKWIDWLCCDDGTTLPCGGTALPVPSCLLRDPLAPNAAPLVLWNTNNGDGIVWAGFATTDVRCDVTSGVFALFHLAGCGTWDYQKLNYVANQPTNNQVEESTSVELSPRMIPQLSKETASDMKFLVTSFFSQSACILSTSSATMHVALQHLQSEVVTMHPILQLSVGTDAAAWEFVVQGFEGKMNAAGAVDCIRCTTSNGSIHLTLRGCGVLVILLRHTNGDSSVVSHLGGGRIAVVVDGEKARYTLISEHQDVAVDIPTMRLREELLHLGFCLLLVDLPCKDSRSQPHTVRLDLAW